MREGASERSGRVCMREEGTIGKGIPRSNEYSVRSLVLPRDISHFAGESELLKFTQSYV